MEKIRGETSFIFFFLTMARCDFRIKTFLVSLITGFGLSFAFQVPAFSRHTRLSQWQTSLGRSPLVRLTGRVKATKISQDVHSVPTPKLLETPQEDSILTNKLIQDADIFFESKVFEEDALLDTKDSSVKSRRMLFASALFTASAAVAASPANAIPAPVAQGSLQWSVSPVNKRSGVTVFDAERSGFNVRFVTYLSRFLLSFDADCQRWWYARAGSLPRTATSEEVNDVRLKQFAAFSASVEVGLQEFRGPDGPKKLMRSLLRRYCPESGSFQQDGKSDYEKAKQTREIKEARRQIALLFGLMETYQPVEEITKLLAAIDNGSIYNVEILDRGSGYALGYGPPIVIFPPPQAEGEGYEQATGRAILEPNGRILRIDLINRGAGYSKPPSVTIMPPIALKGGLNTTQMCAATAKAFIFKNGPNKGRIERLQLVDAGAGYTKEENIRALISPPDLKPSEGGVSASAIAVLEYEVTGIQMTNNGTGYAVENPTSVYIDPPPITARVNMNDPLTAGVIKPDEPLPPTTIPSKAMQKRMPDPNDPASIPAMAAKEANVGGGGGCIGRACYDRPVVAQAYAIAEIDSYKSFRNANDTSSAVVDTKKKEKVVGTSSGPDSSLPSLPVWSGGSTSSSQLLSLLPAGIGLQYDKTLKRYVLAVGQGLREQNVGWTQAYASNKPIDPEFGPRGRSPIQSDAGFSVSTFLRFCASGAICASGVHLLLTPIDVVKTKVQTNPVKYTGILSTFQMIVKEEGPGTFFTGWAPTFLGFFIWGAVSYSSAELLRRIFIDYAGDLASTLEVPIILASASVAATLGSFILCPFEAVRIRSVAQPDYAPNIVGVFNRMVAEEGLSSLFSAVPVFLAKEIPFNAAKFTIFDLFTAYLYVTFPASAEDLQLSLLVSLAGGTLGGLVAAFVSNPADATISEMKKAKSDRGPVETAKMLLKSGGVGALFKGLQLRMFFYSLIVSLQFFVYDSVRYALGIGADDLKLYLDVLGGALQEKGGPI